MRERAGLATSNAQQRSLWLPLTLQLPWGEQKRQNPRYENKYALFAFNLLACLPLAFGTTECGKSGTGRMLSQLHDGGRVQCPEVPRLWRWKHGSRLVFALFSRRRALQHRCWRGNAGRRSEEHTSELQSHSFISYAVFCLKKKI